jgi:tRNA (cmo5U34)-methyltransferase
VPFENGKKMSSKVVKATFNKAAKDYDRIKIQIVPKYREVEALIQGYLMCPKSRRFNILELGTGTGKWALGILRAFPNANYHGIDFSEQMLQQASRRLKRFSDRVLLENLDLNQEIPTGKFDLIHSVFTIHHIRNKCGFFSGLRTLLKPNGLFIYADITIASSQDLEEFFLDSWRAFMRNSRWPNHKIKMIIDDHLKNDIPETIEVQLQYLREAGFRSCDLIWRHEKFAAFYARN